MEEFQDDEHEIIEEEKEDSDDDNAQDDVQGKTGTSNSNKHSDRCNTEQNVPNEADDPLLPTFAPENSNESSRINPSNDIDF